MILPQILSYLLTTPCCIVWYTQFRRCNQSPIWSGQLVEWAKLWQIAFNPRKCYVLRNCRSTCPFIHPYTMLGHTLQAVDHYPYLGVSLSEDLNWKPHILNITNKANSTLGFVKRNLHHCSQKVKDQAYKSPVRPALEYGCTLWDPYRVYQKSRLKQVQHRAERFVTRTYTKEEQCVTNALKKLNWPTLEKRSQVQLDWHWCTNLLPTRPLLISSAMYNISLL